MKIDYTLYFVTDRDLMTTDTLEEAVEKALIGGATVVQLREKDADGRDFYNTALSIKKICKRYKVPLIINDRVDIAMAVDADGVHLGQKDLPIEIARKLMGDNKIIGISCSDLQKAEAAQKNGADYIGVGAMYRTNTKSDTHDVTLDDLRIIRENIDIPIVCIGGIKKDRIKDFKGIPVDGFAVVSAIIAQEDITLSAREIKEEIIRYRS